MNESSPPTTRGIAECECCHKRPPRILVERHRRVWHCLICFFILARAVPVTVVGVAWGGEGHVHEQEKK